MKQLTPLSLIVLLAGCASFSGSGDFDATVTNLQWRQSTALETTAIFTVRLENEGTEAVEYTGGAFKFYVDGRLMGKGLSNERARVERLASATVPVEVHLRNLAMATRIKQIVEARRVTVRTDATVYLQRGGGERRARISKESTVDVADFTPTR